MITTIINQKGGTGKTTTAAALVSYYHEQGRRVLAVDLDPQCNLTLAMGADTSRRSILGALTGEAEPRETVQQTESGECIAGSAALAAAESIIKDTGKEYRLREALESITSSYEHIIIDSPPALGVLSINALVAADAVIIPCQADIFSIQGLKQLESSINAVKKYCNPALYIAGILLTRHNPRTVLSRDLQTVLEKEAAELNTRIFSQTIRDSVTIKQAQALQKPLFSMQGAAIDDYRAFITEYEAITKELKRK